MAPTTTNTTIGVYEARKSTAEPLVEIHVNGDGSDGAWEPAGRRLATTPRTDGLNSHGLTKNEEVAFEVAANRLRRSLGMKAGPDEDFKTADEIQAVKDAGVTADKQADFIRDRRATNPLPTSFATLPEGDPSNNTKPASEQAAAAEPPKPVLKDQKAPGTPVEVPQDIQAQLPQGTTVVKHENGTELVANIPASVDGRSGFYRVAVGVGHGLEHLVAAVKTFVEKHL